MVQTQYQVLVALVRRLEIQVNQEVRVKDPRVRVILLMMVLELRTPVQTEHSKYLSLGIVQLIQDQIPEPLSRLVVLT